MAGKKRIVFHTGGSYHPDTVSQARAVIGWLGGDYDYGIYEGTAAFAALNAADLFVPMGMHWTGMAAPEAGGLAYHRLSDVHWAAFQRYVAAGRPLLVHHAAICSYDDRPSFAELLGFRWVRGVTHHPPLGPFTVSVRESGHPVVAGVQGFRIVDELYCDVEIKSGLAPEVHATAEHEGQAQPLVVTLEGGRIAGAGRVVFLANGHDMRAFASPMLQRLWRNAVGWLLAD